MKTKKIAIVYDWMDSWGGVERLLLTLHEMFPEADFFTSYYDSKKAAWAKNITIHTSFIQVLPGFIKKSRILSLPLYPYAFESFDFKDYDGVISVSSSFAKGIITRPETFHLSYLLTPTRFLWSHADQYIQKDWKSPLTSVYLEKLRAYDIVAAQRPDRILCLSQAVSQRCKKYYRRDCDVVYPPFDFDYWSKVKNDVSQLKISDNKVLHSAPKKYYLVVSRLEPYKKVDQAIVAFNSRKDENLVVVGSGTEEGRLKQMANGNIQFLKSVPDEELAYLYSNAEAVIMPQEEDFGYVSLEAQYFSCPVIAYGAGGALETVKEGISGIFYKDQTVESLQTALEKHHTISYNIKSSLKTIINSPIERFSKNVFEKEIKRYFITN